MGYSYNKKLVKTARALRRNMTPEEKKIWYLFLRRLPVTVNRQKNIGNYIVDFFIYSKNIVIEIDGAQHEMALNRENDQKRDEYFADQGILVLRYSNNDINCNFNTVCNDILCRLNITAADINL